MLRARVVRTLLATLAVAAVLAGAFAVGRATGLGAPIAAAQAGDPGPHHAQDIVNTYLGILNSGMTSGSCDFSGLSTVYAPDASLILTGGPFSPGGPFGSGGAYGEQEFDGLDAITGAYGKLCGLVGGPKGAQWTQDAAQLLAPNVLVSYEHVSVGGKFRGRCVHVFTISGDQIASVNWSVYA